MHFWYNVNDNEFIRKESSQNCKCYVGFEKDVEHNIDVESKEYTTKNNNGYTCTMHDLINTSNYSTHENEWIIL